MQSIVNWTDPINWLIATTLLILLVGQIWLIARNPSLSIGRKWVRGGLNGLLWLLLTGYFLQPEWPIDRPARHILLVGDGVPSAFVRRMKDSLRIQESFTSQNFKANVDSVTMLGQRFPTETLTKLSNVALRWIPYDAPDQLQSIRWKGIVQQGEMQHVTGRIFSSETQPLKLRFGNRTLDSVALREGDNTFAFQFPAFALGQNQVNVILGSTTLDTLRYFARSNQPLTIQFLLNNPDFESKTLADWLGKQGHSVTISATLSKNLSSTLRINNPGKSISKTPDLIITEPANANNVAVRKAIVSGKAVMFINLTNPETDCQLINRAMGSRWQVRKMSNEPIIPLSNGLNALPYRFVDNLNQFPVTNFPVAVQQTTGRLGVSLLSETYPLALSGDSLTYTRLWTSVLARLVRPDQNTFQVEAPVFKGIRQSILVNSSGKPARFVRVGSDTTYLHQLPINERLLEGVSLFPQSGWQSVQDTLAVYVNDVVADDLLRNKQIISQFIKAHLQQQTIRTTLNQAISAQLPNWIWLLFLITCFTALWVEPKIS
ncbi:hypothetical protein IC229_25915 [Spirosoma sp. BT702]|uniref:Aerotolerance regulator N-terminal domain-containing protein n=1 Tax=Spirosoma profusum TaxID=2771354 RepID=A0A926Y026_9BACT|nr:hypothetical protein [Spirosoma profusum]MBD2704109.1 hypothetical protein [Spirosoma profusum]